MQIGKQRKGKIKKVDYCNFCILYYVKFFMRKSSKLKKIHIQTDNSVTQKAEKHQSIT